MIHLLASWPAYDTTVHPFVAERSRVLDQSNGELVNPSCPRPGDPGAIETNEAFVELLCDDAVDPNPGLPGTGGTNMPD